VFLDTVMVGNLAEKSLALAAILAVMSSGASSTAKRARRGPCRDSGAFGRPR
jgi:hypothetical protein